jgi:hypothetical protein
MPVALLALGALAALAAARESDPGEALQRFRAAFPRARLVAGRHGGLEHASGFADRSGGGGEEGARRFLAIHGSAFGVQDARVGLELLRTVGTPGGPGAVVFRRVVDGLPVFGGEVAVGLAPDGAVSMVNGSPAPALRRGGTFRASPAAARAAALSEGETLAGPVEAGWLEFGSRLLPAYRLRTVAAAPPGVFHAYVDAESGRLLYRAPLAVSAQTCPPCPVPPCICAFQDSPLMPPPPGPDGNLPVSFPALGLPAVVPAGYPLSGTLAAVFNCRGTDASRIPSGCTAQTLSDAAGSFLSSPDPTRVDATDAFAEQSAYFHVDAQSRFFSGLDPAFPGIGLVTGFVNVFEGGAPLDNAYYLPSGTGGGIMVFGQGAQVDLAYDAEIVYHELTHAAVGATSAFEQYLDTLGLNVDPASANEGTADTFAFANPRVLQPCLAAYVASSQASACLRNADNRRTCRGNGPSDGANPGRAGEVHQDGQIWSGFAWSLFQAAMDHDAALADGTRLRDAMTRALFRSLETAGSRASFEGYAATVQAQVAADPDLGAAGADLVGCVAAQRDLAGCSDRTVAMYGGERFTGVIRGIAAVTPAPQQYFLDVPCGATALRIQSGDDTGRGLLFIRYGKPVDFEGPDFKGVRYDWLLPHEEADAVLRAGPDPCPSCDACGTHTPLGAGRWYFLPAGLDRAAFWLEISIEAPAGVAVPARSPYLFGPGQPAGQEVNLCAWGGGPVPQPLRPAAYSGPPDLGTCSAPVAPQLTLPKQCQAPPPPPSNHEGCSSGPTGAASIIPLLPLAFRRRPRRQAVSPAC